MYMFQAAESIRKTFTPEQRQCYFLDEINLPLVKSNEVLGEYTK